MIVQSKFQKFRMADSIWWPFLTKFNVSRSNYTKMNIRGFLSWLITVPSLKIQNSKWRIQYRGHFWLNSRFFFSNWTKKRIWGFWRSLITVLRSTFKVVIGSCLLGWRVGDSPYANALGRLAVAIRKMKNNHTVECTFSEDFLIIMCENTFFSVIRGVLKYFCDL